MDCIAEPIISAHKTSQLDYKPLSLVFHSSVKPKLRPTIDFNIETPANPIVPVTESEEQNFLTGYNEFGGPVMNRTERTILPDLATYPFPDDIKNGADVVFNKMRYQVRRGKIRDQMLFFCTYCSYLEEINKQTLDFRNTKPPLNIDPIQLGTQFGLSQGEVQRCDSLFSPLQTGYRPPSTYTSPLTYLPNYCQNIDLSHECIDEIMKLAQTIMEKDPTLHQENPQTVAAGFLRYYTTTNGITTEDPQKITRITGRSNVTIDGMFRRIATIDNS